MKIIYIFFVILLSQLIGHCSTTGDEPSTSRASINLRRISPDKNPPQLPVENVQLTEYKDGEMIELPQQNFFDLKKEKLMESELFEDPQFPKELFLDLGQTDLRPKDIVEKPQEPVLFIDNKEPFYVKQGKLGDCWFVVGLLHLQYHQNLFKFIVQPYDQTFNTESYAGIFHFRFWQAGTWIDVVIDDRLPTVGRKLIYTFSGYPNEFWPALIEKAYAKLLYRSYGNLKGGFSRISMQDLSGGISETFMIKPDLSLFEIIQDAKDRLTMISCGTVNRKKFRKGALNLMPLHFYAITDVKIVKGDKAAGQFKLIRIRNPYGRVTEDFHHGNIKKLFTSSTLAIKLNLEVIGESWILYNDFIAHFAYVEICNLTPNQITNHVYSNTGKKLALSAIEGKFMGALTPKQILLNNFFIINPQYRMVLTKPDEGKTKCTVLIGVSLKRRLDLQKVSASSIYFRVLSFDTDDTTKVPRPLATSSLTHHEFGPFTRRGQVGKSIDLEPGTYYIIPYVTDTFKGATFYLRVLSEQQDILEVYDRDIHMPPIVKQMNLLKQNIDLFEIDHELFSTMALDSTINFKGLYDILKDEKLSLNENCHVAQELDDTIVLELELLVTKKLVPQRKLSHSTIARIILITQEVIETYGEKDFPGYLKHIFLKSALKHIGYSVDVNILNAVYALFANHNGLIHLNDYMLIVFALKNRIGPYCEEFNAKLCQDLVLMVHDGLTNFKNLNEPPIHKLRIDEQQFKFILEFIKKLKEIFYSHATGPFYSVAFTKLKHLFDAFNYELTYNIIATVFQRRGNDLDIFYNQFVQSVVDVTLIFGKIQEQMSSNEKGKNSNEDYHKMFDQLWKKQQEKKNSIERNERKADELFDNSGPSKRIKI